nr:hypothetical protein [uncultured Fibrobacter sp.]
MGEVITDIQPLGNSGMIGKLLSVVGSGSRMQNMDILSLAVSRLPLWCAPLSILLVSMPKVGLEFLSALDMAVYRRNAWGFLALQPPASNDLLR